MWIGISCFIHASPADRLPAELPVLFIQVYNESYLISRLTVWPLTKKGQITLSALMHLVCLLLCFFQSSVQCEGRIVDLPVHFCSSYSAMNTGIASSHMWQCRKAMCNGSCSLILIYINKQQCNDRSYSIQSQRSHTETLKTIYPICLNMSLYPPSNSLCIYQPLVCICACAYVCMRHCAQIKKRTECALQCSWFKWISLISL